MFHFSNDIRITRSLVRNPQRDYFGAHTFRVLPGKENAKFQLDQDIRKLILLSRGGYLLIALFLRRQLDWTWWKRLCLHLQHIRCLCPKRARNDVTLLEFNRWFFFVR